MLWEFIQAFLYFCEGIFSGALLGYAVMISGAILLAKGPLFRSPHKEGAEAGEKLVTLQKYEAVFGLAYFFIGISIQILYRAEAIRLSVQSVYENIFFPVVLLTFLSTVLSYRLMRREYFPKYRDLIRNSYLENKYVLQNDGYQEDQTNNSHTILSDEQREYQLSQARDQLKEWARLLDVDLADNISDNELIRVLDKNIL
jgi:hypothetical protein